MSLLSKIRTLPVDVQYIIFEFSRDKEIFKDCLRDLKCAYRINPIESQSIYDMLEYYEENEEVDSEENNYNIGLYDREFENVLKTGYVYQNFDICLKNEELMKWVGFNKVYVEVTRSCYCYDDDDDRENYFISFTGLGNIFVFDIIIGMMRTHFPCCNHRFLEVVDLNDDGYVELGFGS